MSEVISIKFKIKILKAVRYFEISHDTIFHNILKTRTKSIHRFIRSIHKSIEKIQILNPNVYFEHVFEQLFWNLFSRLRVQNVP